MIIPEYGERPSRSSGPRPLRLPHLYVCRSSGCGMPRQPTSLQRANDRYRQWLIVCVQDGDQQVRQTDHSARSRIGERRSCFQGSDSIRSSPKTCGSSGPPISGELLPVPEAAERTTPHRSPTLCPETVRSTAVKINPVCLRPPFGRVHGSAATARTPTPYSTTYGMEPTRIHARRYFVP